MTVRNRQSSGQWAVGSGQWAERLGRSFYLVYPFCRLPTAHLTSVVNAFPAKVQYNDCARTELMLEGQGPYWKSPIWNVSVGTAGSFAT
jgi:hypothetical protein